MKWSFINLYLYFMFFLFFFNDTATTEIYTLSLHDALPIYISCSLFLHKWFSFLTLRPLLRGFGDKQQCSKVSENEAAILFQKIDSRQNLINKEWQFATATIQKRHIRGRGAAMKVGEEGWGGDEANERRRCESPSDTLKWITVQWNTVHSYEYYNSK